MAVLGARRHVFVDAVLVSFALRCAGLIALSRDTMEGVQPTQGLMDIVARPNAFDRQLHSFEANLDDSAIDGGSLSAVLIQAPLIENADPIVRVPSRYADRIVDVEEGPLLATAFHPELTGDARVHAYFPANVRRSFLRR